VERVGCVEVPNSTEGLRNEMPGFQLLPIVSLLLRFVLNTVLRRCITFERLVVEILSGTVELHTVSFDPEAVNALTQRENSRFPVCKIINCVAARVVGLTVSLYESD